MSDPISQVTTQLPSIDLVDDIPVRGQRLEFVSNTLEAFTELSEFAAALSRLAAELNAITETVNVRLTESGQSTAVDAGLLARGSSAYRALVRDVPLSVADVAAKRTLLLYNIAPDGARAVSDWFIAELGPGGPRWAGPLANSLHPS